MIVADCSVVVDVLTVPEGTAELRELLSAEPISVPALIDYEFVSALKGLTRSGSLSIARAQDAFTDFDDLTMTRWDAVDVFRRRAFDLHDKMSAYDAAYVVLARSLECPLVTRDRRLHKAACELVEVRVL
jgi:predicted nucleic acid-binding protein